MTQQAFAEKLGISSQAVINYEKHGRIPSRAILNKMSSEFGVSRDWLLTGLGEKKVIPGITFSDEKNTQHPESIEDATKKSDTGYHFLEKPACDEGEKLLPGSSFSGGEKAATVAAFPDSAGTQQPEIIEGGKKKAATFAGNEGGDAPPQLGFAASRPAAAAGEAAPGPAAAAPLPAAPAAAPDLAAQLVAALRENAALLRELGDLRVREVEQRVELERLRAELSSARARCALLEERERERERERTDSGG